MILRLHRAAALCGISHRAMATLLAGGVDPRSLRVRTYNAA